MTMRIAAYQEMHFRSKFESERGFKAAGNLGDVPKQFRDLERTEQLGGKGRMNVGVR